MTIINQTRESKVDEFNKAAGVLTFKDNPEGAELTMDLIFEEFMEFNEAAFEYEQAIDNGVAWANPDKLAELRAAMVKEWADLQYVVSRAAVFFDIPADPAFNRVHESNMSKLVDGKVLRREDGKILKPDTYIAPDMKGL